MHDKYASTLALARTLLDACQGETATVRAASLRLCLETLLELGGALPSPLPTARPRPNAEAAAARTVASRLAVFAVEQESGVDDGRF